MKVLSESFKNGRKERSGDEKKWKEIHVNVVDSFEIQFFCQIQLL